MLTLPQLLVRPVLSRKREKGVVLIIALVVLIAMTIAGLALVRSMDTTTVISGNLAFQQSATHSADVGVESAVAWLKGAGATTLESSSPTNGYVADGSAAENNPAEGQTWEAFWATKLVGRAYTPFPDGDSAGNTVAYVIDRLCSFAGGAGTGAACNASPLITSAPGNAEEGGEIWLAAPSVVYYRITVRVAGPRNTVSFVQAVVAL